MVEVTESEVTEHDCLYSAVRELAAKSPAAVAVVGYDGARSSYAQLVTAADTVAEQLRIDAAGARVLGLAVDDPFTLVSVYFAAAKLKKIVVLLDSRLSESEKAHRVTKFDIDALVSDRASRPGSIVVEPGNRTEATGRVSDYAADDFVIHCTSGSTGEPKGIVLSQRAIAARVRSWSAEMALGQTDVVLCALPLWHCHGIDILTLPALLSGATVVFARGAHLTGRGLARMIEEHSVTFISGLPVMYHMLAATRGVEPAQLATLRIAITGSAPISAETQDLVRSRFGLSLRQVYGLSEIGAITYDSACAGGGTVGTPMKGIEWRLEPSAVRAGEVELCELYVRAPSLARGYYRDEPATAAMFVNGWLRTRDLVEARPGGWFVRGRLSSFINVSGNKVAPVDVESVLRRCPGVVDCAVAGIPDGDDEQVAALVVTESRWDIADIRRNTSSALLPYQAPQLYRVVESIPRTPIGKIDYDAVKRLLTDGTAAAGRGAR
ncbi:class I adenylate-forming enzyme family protein [Nocardia nova]|uniref:class I adenylate-forming enzyme family protein n=1 Tax=Nocardia nova TaxID=37330 RepID=UPI0007A4FE55|nr:class I adenylate-forming enzyme family protein [Nocardia nova]